MSNTILEVILGGEASGIVSFPGPQGPAGEGAVLPNTIVYTTGNQTISGSKSFASRPDVNGTGVLLSGEIAALPSAIVYTTGNQTISGSKSFASRPDVNGTGVLLSGETIKLPDSILFSTGTQIISGLKKVENNLEISGTGIIRGLNLLDIDELNISGINLIITGSSIKIYNEVEISGDKVLTRNTADNLFSTITNLASTGSTLNTRIDNLGNTYATITNLASTGSTLETNINSLSSGITNNYIAKNNGSFINISGNKIIVNSGYFIENINISKGDENLIIQRDSLDFQTDFPPEFEISGYSFFKLNAATSNPYIKIENTSGLLNGGNFPYISLKDNRYRNYPDGTTILDRNLRLFDGNIILNSGYTITFDTAMGALGIGDLATLRQRSNLYSVNTGELKTDTIRLNASGSTGLFLELYANNLIYSSGDQSISGIKNFYSRPTINDTGVMLAGETILANQISNSTAAGRDLLTGSRQSQRDNLSLFPSYTNFADLTGNGPAQSNRIYITTNNWKSYAWVPSLSQYLEISPTPTGELDVRYASILDLASTGSNLQTQINTITNNSISLSTSQVIISSVINGNFSNLAGLTKNPSFDEWWDGIPLGWSGVNTNFTIRSGVGSNNYVANIGQLSAGPSGNSFRQNLGKLPITSNVELTFTYSEPFADAVLNAAIYDGNYGNLATGQYTTPGTYTLTGSSIPANTNIIIGFWSPNIGTVNPILDDVSVSQTTPATTWIFPTGLPRNNANLPIGGLYANQNELGEWVLKINF